MDPRPAGDNAILAVALDGWAQPEAQGTTSETGGGVRPGTTLLDEVISESGRGRAAGVRPDRLERFLREDSAARALCLWLGLESPSAPRPERAEITSRLSRDIARIDDLLSRQ